MDRSPSFENAASVLTLDSRRNYTCTPKLSFFFQLCVNSPGWRTVIKTYALFSEQLRFFKVRFGHNP